VIGRRFRTKVTAEQRGTVEGATEILRQCVERYNELDEGFICTIEREELCDILYKIGECCGPDSEDDRVDEWRDWSGGRGRTGPFVQRVLPSGSSASVIGSRRVSSIV
jgi:hypothetical protein